MENRRILGHLIQKKMLTLLIFHQKGQIMNSIHSSDKFSNFQLIVMSRIDRHKADEAARLEAERTKMQAEATAKAEREAAAKLAAEEVRIRAEEQAKARAEAVALANREQLAAAEAKEKIDEQSRLVAEAAQRKAVEERKAVIDLTAKSFIEQEAFGISAIMTKHGEDGLSVTYISATELYRPTRIQMIEAIAKAFNMNYSSAEQCLRDAFAEVAA
jgi:hypothetical protein